MGFDGIAVDQYVRPELQESIDIESMAMEFSFRFLELRDAATSLEMGAITDIMLKAEYGTVVVRVLSAEYFVALVLGELSNMGKSRWMLRSHARALAADLFAGSPS
jgi:predicted regulator of Ras-like GTPase activity (Roadblock/LC7/MglB family)